MSDRNTIKTVGAVFLIICIGLSIMMLLIHSRKPPKRMARNRPGVLVKAVPFTEVTEKVKISATGTVQATEKVSVIPRVSGAVIYANPLFETGGFLKKGDILFKIETIDFELAVERSRAAVESAKAALLEAQSKKEISVKEWQVYGKGTQPSSPLVLHEPQLKSAEAALASAEAQLRQNVLNLSRTVIKAPFNCLVTHESIAEGQFVNAGNPVATVSATDTSDVVVSLPIRELQWIKFRDKEGGMPEDAGSVCVTSGNDDYKWDISFVKTLNTVEKVGGMPQLLVRVSDPYNLSHTHDPANIPLQEGLFVKVTLYGKEIEKAFRIPSEALREDHTIWTLTEENTLAVYDVNVLRKEKGFFLVKWDLNSKEKLVVSSITGAAPGMKLREI